MKREREENEGTTLESWDITNCSTTSDTISVSTCSQVFESKTCNRIFSLCGHMASHKRVKLEGEKSLGLGIQFEPKTHECFICGQGFSADQALGGHMRRHNRVFSSINKVAAKVSVLNRSCNDKVFSLDLNLTPLENDLKLLLFGKVSPKVNLSSF